MNKKGVDVSKWQGRINWHEARNDGVEFAILREGYGKESPNQIDKRFEENYRNAKAVGIPVGVYHYSYADSVEDARKEAQFCLKNITGKQLEYPICFDIEDKEQLKLNNRQRTDICKAFCEEIEKAGYYVMIYCNLNWYKNYLYSEELKKYDLWLAQWSRILCSTSAESISILSCHIGITAAFVQKDEVTAFVPRYKTIPFFPFLCHIGDAPVRWHGEISSYGDSRAFSENARRCQCLPEDSDFR